jgi:hypothetical protein
VLGEQKARLYIIRRCVVMLLCWSDWSQAWWTCAFFSCYFFFFSSFSPCHFGGWMTWYMNAPCLLASCGRQGYWLPLVKTQSTVRC